MKPVNLAAQLAAAETELACLKLALAQVKEDRDQLKHERDAWRRVAEKLYGFAKKQADRHFASLERRPWWRLRTGAPDNDQASILSRLRSADPRTACDVRRSVLGGAGGDHRPQ
jgi:hypothetical protein